MNASITLAAPLYSVGVVVVVPFPSSTGAEPKRRPAVVLVVVVYGADRDYLVCLIASQAAPDPFRLPLTQSDIVDGFLSVQSYLRPAYVYTASERLISRRIGVLAPLRLEEAAETLMRLLQSLPQTSADLTL